MKKSIIAYILCILMCAAGLFVTVKVAKESVDRLNAMPEVSYELMDIENMTETEAEIPAVPEQAVEEPEAEVPSGEEPEIEVPEDGEEAVEPEKAFFEFDALNIDSHDGAFYLTDSCVPLSFEGKMYGWSIGGTHTAEFDSGRSAVLLDGNSLLAFTKNDASVADAMAVVKDTHGALFIVAKRSLDGDVAVTVRYATAEETVEADKAFVRKLLQSVKETESVKAVFEGIEWNTLKRISVGESMNLYGTYKTNVSEIETDIEFKNMVLVMTDADLSEEAPIVADATVSDGVRMWQAIYSLQSDENTAEQDLAVYYMQTDGHSYQFVVTDMGEENIQEGTEGGEEANTVTETENDEVETVDDEVESTDEAVESGTAE